MPWPLSQDYNEAIQTPTQCFSDPELQRGEAVTNELGLPMPCSGNFADVYAVQAGQQKWAVKCFTRQIQGLRERYAEISKYLQQVKLPFMVDFKFLEQGIRVRGQWYPILKMQWVEGQALNAFVKSQVDNPAILRTTSQLWAKMGSVLREANLAHGDLQHGNVLLVPGAKAGTVGLKLVDYDGMCVPALEFLKATEVGHPAYQHPQRLREASYGLHIDRFSHLVIYTALRALAVGGRPLWDRFDNGDNLLFMQKDFENPPGALAFQELFKLADPEVAKLVQALSVSCQKPVDQTPLLDELISSDSAKITSSTARSTSRQSSPKAAAPTTSASTHGHQGADWSTVGGNASSRLPVSGKRKDKSKLGLLLGISVIGVATLAGIVLLLSNGTQDKPDARAKVSSTPLLLSSSPSSTPLQKTQRATFAEPKPEPKPDPNPIRLETWQYNRFFAYSGTASGIVRMPESKADWKDFFLYNQTTIFDRLNERGIPWHVYFGDFPLSAVLMNQWQKPNALRYRLMPFFYEHAARAEAEFPAFAFIEPRYLLDPNDDHPDHDVFKGQELVANVYNALRANEELWRSTLLVITYDEHGGFYDHVTPPLSVAPDVHKRGYTFDRLGVRVPALLVSPWVERQVVSTEFDHTSILKYLVEKWKLGPLGERVARANSIGAAIRSTGEPRYDCPASIPIPPYTSQTVPPAAPNGHQKAMLEFKQFAEEQGMGPRMMRATAERPATIQGEMNEAAEWMKVFLQGGGSG